MFIYKQINKSINKSVHKLNTGSWEAEQLGYLQEWSQALEKLKSLSLVNNAEPKKGKSNLNGR